MYKNPLKNRIFSINLAICLGLISGIYMPTAVQAERLSLSGLKNQIDDVEDQADANSVAINTKQNRVTGVCPPGQSIGAIFTSGNVACEVDTDTTYTAGRGLELNGTRFKRAGGAVSIGPYQFVSNSPASCPMNFFGGNSLYFSAGNGCVAVGSVQLPHGSNVTGITCHILDNNATGGRYINQIRLIGSVLTTGTRFALLSNSDFSSNSSDIVAVTASNSINVNNEDYAYWIEVRFGSNGGNSLRLYNCKLEYNFG